MLGLRFNYLRIMFYFHFTVVGFSSARWSQWLDFYSHLLSINLRLLLSQTNSVSFMQCVLVYPHNRFKTICHFMCEQFLTFKTLRHVHTVYLWILCGFQNKQRLFPYTELTGWFLNLGRVCLLRGTDWIFKYNSRQL